MIKEVNVLLSAGHDVKVYYSFWTGWAKTLEDEAIRDFPPGTFTEVGGNPFNSPGSYFLSRVIYKVAREWFRFLPRLFNFAVSRNARALIRAARSGKADLYIAHNLGALPAACLAAKKWQTTCGFDAEDYHRGEFENTSGKDYRIAVRAEEAYIPQCDYITAASPLIAKAYNKLVPSKGITTINNVFSRRYRQPRPEKTPDKPLRLFWFSQSVGPARGLEQVIEALNVLPDCEIGLFILGNCPPVFREQLLGAAHRPGQIHFLEPVAESEIFRLAAGFDIGLASELPHCENRDICLTNKLFTYLLAGNAILASRTSAQENFIKEHPGIGDLYQNGDVAGLAGILQRLYADRVQLHDRRTCAWELSDTLNWEKESVIFLSIIRSVLGK
jgi:hypothetical protein